MKPTFDFGSAFGALTGNPPFPWQRRLFGEWLSKGKLPPAIEIPTGLGKTAVMAVWLVARATGADLPRRLVHVVDRQSLADHASELAEDLRDRLQRLEALEPVRRGLCLNGRPLPISTLRGCFLDDREWMTDPSAPAIIVSTVEKAGSRLLFEGHGLPRPLRPYAAGLMGCDTLVLLDEAHLSRAFESVLRTIESGQRVSSETQPAAAGVFAGRMARGALPPPLRVLPLIASPYGAAAGALRLDAEDRKNEIVRERLDAEKLLTVEELDDGSNLDAALADRAWAMMLREASGAGRSVRIAVFCDRVSDAEQVAARLRRRSRKERPESTVILFGGDRRIRERSAVSGRLKQHGLLTGSDPAQHIPVFLVATVAGEAGVDLDADHSICDLVAWDRMVRRLGRVNRRGSGRSRVLVIDPGPRSGGNPQMDAGRAAVRALLAALPENSAGEAMATPAALAGLGEDGVLRERVLAASTRPPLHPGLTRPLVDAWSMTSLIEHPGRPEVQPWLRGWLNGGERTTTVIWRRHLPVRMGDDPAGTREQPANEVAAFFEATPPQMAEGLETEAGLAADWIRKRARRILGQLDPSTEPLEGKEDREPEDRAGAGERKSRRRAPGPGAPVAFLLDGANRPLHSLSLISVLDRPTRELERALGGRFLVVDARLGGLRDGMLDDLSERPVSTIEDGWGGGAGEDTGAGRPPFRVSETSDAERRAGNGSPPRGHWRETHAMPCRITSQGDIETWVVVEKEPGGGGGEESRSIASRAQPLPDHQAWVVDETARIARALGLEEADRAMLVAAARRHDEGKRALRWQRAFGADGRDGPRGKTPGPVNRHILNGYRHELKSTLDAEDAGLGGIPRSDARFDLALHLIAAHHGYARPTIPVDGYDDLPPSVAAQRAHEIAARFARLQRQWGPWGLAWWEALLRAADQGAARMLEDEAAGWHGQARSAASASRGAG